LSVLELSPPRELSQWKLEHGWTVARALAVTGGLSNPAKMPCHGYNLPAERCHNGSKMRAKAQSMNRAERRAAQKRGMAGVQVCGGCYALKGRYVFPSVKAAMARRIDCLIDPDWTDAMVFLIGWYERDTRCFRWHDSGDLQGMWHLLMLVEIAERLPWVDFWLPTREYALVHAYREAYGAFPPNLTVRESAALIGHVPVARDGRVMSGVAARGQVLPEGVHVCPAPSQGGFCGDCRACWDPSTDVVMYKLH
jgi:hypothetical protein